SDVCSSDLNGGLIVPHLIVLPGVFEALPFAFLLHVLDGFHSLIEKLAVGAAIQTLLHGRHRPDTTVLVPIVRWGMHVQRIGGHKTGFLYHGTAAIGLIKGLELV